MKSDLSLISKFDTYIKKSLVNELKTSVKEDKGKQKRYVNFSELSQAEHNKLCCLDDYPSDVFEESIKTRLFDVVIHNELLYEALLSIKPLSRDLILLKYWGDMTDVEVGQHLNMSKASVNKHKLRTLSKLKEVMEELKENE